MFVIIRGLYIGRAAMSAMLTMTAFAGRALSKFWMNPIIELLINPLVVFVLFLTAGLIVTYPLLKGVKGLIIAPALVIIVAFFVYAYYILP